ncbi:MAG TPA: NADH-quinone oxidoreductase subunit L [Terracidiphilus sp.]|nr:NADH-quinone oxidoreductase subunit L [Terracidiphilus sp.]
MNTPLHLWLIPLLPFAGFLINGILGRRLPKWLVSTVALLAPLAALGVVLNAASGLFGIGPSLSSLPYVETCPLPWINIGTLHIDFSFVLDQLSLVMLLVVSGVGFLIHVYSVGYMSREEGYARYFSYLNLFLFFMTVLVLAGNALVMFVGWEGVGLASYLLIGFWFQKNSAADAGKKAFIVNRIGDFGFLIGMFLLLANFGTLTFSEICAQLGANPGWQGGVLTVTALCLLLGAIGKSAQLPLYVWLPDAMEGPTPVSALIHAATMVTAGVYMIARTHVLFDHSPFALGTVAVIGAATAIFAATIGLVQNDIKRVLAYSTISQIGYMFLGCGVAAYSAAIFHLVTHAFFKALLFLAAGSVIHAIGGEQDLRRMGGLWRKLPVTFAVTTVGVLAIAGFPPFAGFFSKDAILYAAYLHGPSGRALWFVGVVTALLTSFYMFRLWYLAFLGKPLGEAAPHHSTPWSMLGPLLILALLSICGGWIGIERSGGWINIERFSSFLAPAVGAKAAEGGSAGLEFRMSVAAVVVAFLGWYIAHVFYQWRPSRRAEFAASLSGPYTVLANKYYVDEFYRAAVVKPLLAISTYFLGWFVEKALLGGAAWLLGGLALFTGALLQRWQSGNLRSYAAWLAAGAAAVLLFIVVPWSAFLANFGFHLNVAGH